MPKGIDESTTLSEILSNKELTIYGVIKRIRIFLYFHPENIEAKKKLAESLAMTGYGKEESDNIYKELELKGIQRSKNPH